MELRIIAGWEKNSTMPEVYVHLSGGDIEKKMLEKAGFVTSDEYQNLLNRLRRDLGMNP